MNAVTAHGDAAYRAGCRCAICLASKVRFDATPEGQERAARRAHWEAIQVERAERRARGLAVQADKAARRAHWEAIQAAKARTPEQIVADRERLWPDGTKPCPQCDRRRPILKFGIDRSRPDGRTERCRDCRNGRRT